MQTLFVLIFSIFLTEVSWAQSPQCLQLFLAKNKPIEPTTLDLEQYSWRRFHPPLHIESQQTPLEIAWLKKMNAPVPSWNIKHFFKENDEVFASIHLSPDQSIAITRSNKNIIRVYNARTERKISEIDFFKMQSAFHANEDRAEVIFVSDHHFVIGKEDSGSIHRNKNLGILAFHPHQLVVIDLQGKIISSFYSDVRIKGAVVSKSGDFWISADQHEVKYHQMLKDSHINLNVLMQSRLPEADYFISAITLSPNENILYVAYSKLKGPARDSSFVSAFDIQNAKSPQLVKEFEVGNAQIIYKMESTVERLKISYSDRGQTSNSSSQTITIDAVSMGENTPR